MLKEGRGMPTGGDAMVVVGAGAGIAWPVPKPTFVYGVNPPNSVGGWATVLVNAPFTAGADVLNPVLGVATGNVDVEVEVEAEAEAEADVEGAPKWFDAAPNNVDGWVFAMDPKGLLLLLLLLFGVLLKIGGAGVEAGTGLNEGKEFDPKGVEEAGAGAGAPKVVVEVGAGGWPKLKFPVAGAVVGGAAVLAVEIGAIGGKVDVNAVNAVLPPAPPPPKTLEVGTVEVEGAPNVPKADPLGAGVAGAVGFAPKGLVGVVVGAGGKAKGLEGVVVVAKVVGAGAWLPIIWAASCEVFLPAW
jgi:hypothetical protein